MAREADKLAGAGSFLEKMKNRRDMIESGEMAEVEEPTPTTDDRPDIQKRNGKKITHDLAH